MIRKLLMALQAFSFIVGLAVIFAGGVICWDVASHGIPEIVDLKVLHTTKARYARVTAALEDTGVHFPRDKKNSASYFYTIRLEDKLVLVKSLHRREEGPASSFFVLVQPYEGTRVETYFSLQAAARGLPEEDVRAGYADRMLQYFDNNPRKYGRMVLGLGALVFLAAAGWTAVAKNGGALLRMVLTLGYSERERR